MRTLVAALAALAVTAAPAPAATEVAESGSVRAEFSYSDTSPPTDLTLRVFDSGVLRFEERIPDLWPGGYGDRPSVVVRDLGGDAAPEVLLDLFSGGAHCCLSTRVYFGVQHVEHDWRDAGYAVDDVDDDGRPELRGADGGFAGAFGAYAYSRFPLKVLRWTGSRLRDVTGSSAVEPLLRREAAAFEKDYRSARGRLRRNPRNIGARDTVRAALAAYTADQCSLGRCERGFELVQRARRRKELRGYRTYERDLRRLLRRLDYTD